MNPKLIDAAVARSIADSPAVRLGLSVSQIEIAEDLLGNDEGEDTPEQIAEHLITQGFTPHQARETVKFLSLYACEIFTPRQGPLDFGHHSLAWSEETRGYVSTKKPDTQESLTNELRVWCTVHSIVLASADDLLAIHRASLRTEQRVWLEDFCKRWDKVSAGLVKAMAWDAPPDRIGAPYTYTRYHKHVALIDQRGASVAEIPFGNEVTPTAERAIEIAQGMVSRINESQRQCR